MENSTIIKKKNEETLSYISKNKKLEEEKKYCESEIKSLKESFQPCLKSFYDLNHLET